MLKRLTLGLVLLCIGGAFALGWWPEHQRRLALEQELNQDRARFAASESGVRVCQLQDRLLSLLDLIDAKDYSAAQSASSAFFDGVRAETMNPTHRPEFDKILAQRDEVTVALARSDPTVGDTLRAMRAPLMNMRAANQGPGDSKR
jgi:hypothetical protein